jgi:hypothetical protein
MNIRNFLRRAWCDASGRIEQTGSPALQDCGVTYEIVIHDPEIQSFVRILNSAVLTPFRYVQITRGVEPTQGHWGHKGK